MVRMGLAGGVLAASAAVAAGHVVPNVPMPEKGVTAADMLHSGLPLKEPIDLYSSNGQLYVELDYTTCDYAGPKTSFSTRCYAYEGVGMIPGPTLHVHPGDVLIMKITNKLSSKDELEYHNWWQHLNWTNLHFHGAHIDADIPADDVLTMIPSVEEDGTESSIQYVYRLEEYHMPGTAWYHPHGHGSATMQTGTGTLGMIVIEDGEKHVPAFIRDAPNLHLTTLHIPTSEIILYGMQSCVNADIMVPAMFGSEGPLPGPAFTPESAENGIFLVNGMTNPVISLVAGVWYRVRNLAGSPLFLINGQMILNDAAMGCVTKLIAKDTIYLDAPMRDVTSIFLYPGSRADLMVKCDVPGLIQIDSISFPGAEYLAHHVPVYEGPMFQMEILESYFEPAGDLPLWVAQRPCYLADTQSVVGNPEFVTEKFMIYDDCEVTGAEAVPHRKLGEKAVAKAQGERKLAGEYGPDGEYIWHYDEYQGTALAIDLAAAGVPPFSVMGPNGGPLTSCEDLAVAIGDVFQGKYCINGCAFELGFQKGIATEHAVSNLMTPVDHPSVQRAASHVNQWQGQACRLDMEDNYLQAGDIIEWDVWGIDWHPVHFHVHPYRLVFIDFELGNQITDAFESIEEFEALTGNYFHVGDYGDSLQIPVKHAKFHQQLANFATPMINHCHILLHEDIGMMTLYTILGEDGTRTRAQEIDPTCYWTDAEFTGYTITSECTSDADCPAGYMCPTGARRSLKFGTTGPTVCVEDHDM